MIVFVLICAILGGLAALRIAAPFAKPDLGRGGAVAAASVAGVIAVGSMASLKRGARPMPLSQSVWPIPIPPC